MLKKNAKFTKQESDARVMDLILKNTMNCPLGKTQIIKKMVFMVLVIFLMRCNQGSHK